MPKRGFQAPDDMPQSVVKRDLGGGQNDRQHPQMIADNQAVFLQNILLDTAAQTTIRLGQTLVDNDFPPIYLLDESGNILLDEKNIPLLQEGQTG